MVNKANIRILGSSIYTIDVFNNTTTTTNEDVDVTNAKKNSSCFLYFCVCAVNLSTFLCGMALSWPSPVLPKLNGDVDPVTNPVGRPITKLEESWIASIMTLGACVSPFLLSIIANRIGRRNVITLGSVFIFISYVIFSWADTVILFYIGRFVMGLGVGTIFSYIIIYTAELAESHNRGILCSLTGLFLTLGMLFTYSIGPYLEVKYFSIACMFPFALFFGTVTFYVPDSPYYLVSAKNLKEAQLALKALRTNKTETEIQTELLEIQAFVHENGFKKISIRESYKSKAVKRSTVISVGLMILQQIFGINAVISYMETIFRASSTNISPKLSAIYIGIVQVIVNILVLFIILKIGRKTLLYISAAGSGLSLIALGSYFFFKDNDYNIDQLNWLPITSLVCYIIFFNFGNTIWVIIGEILPADIKIFMAGVNAFSGFFLAFVVTLTFPHISNLIGMGPAFWIFAGLSFIGIAFIYTFVVEGKGKTFAEIQEILNK